MVESGAVCIAYETVEAEDGSLPLLTPILRRWLDAWQSSKGPSISRSRKGRGVLLGGVPGVPPGRVLVLGGGVSGTQAAKMAAGLGAHVTIMDINMERLRRVNDIMPHHVVTEYSNAYNIRQAIATHDLIVGAVLVKGGKAPHLITRDMLSLMRPGTVIVDIAVDQGGCVETTRPTTHDNPVYIVDDVVHYSVANMPGAVPYTSTLALTNVTCRLCDRACREGLANRMQRRPGLGQGAQHLWRDIVYAAVELAFAAA